MNLTAEQVEAVQKGEPVRLSDPLIGDCVVVRTDVFQALAYDDGALTNRERGYLLREFGRRAGWDDPELDVYEEYRESPSNARTSFWLISHTATAVEASYDPRLWFKPTF